MTILKTKLAPMTNLTTMRTGIAVMAQTERRTMTRGMSGNLPIMAYSVVCKVKLESPMLTAPNQELTFDLEVHRNSCCCILVRQPNF